MGALALTLVILYAAWHEYKQGNRRDSSLLAAAGAVGLMGSAVAWLH
jgi:hypothetical protein